MAAAVEGANGVSVSGAEGSASSSDLHSWSLSDELSYKIKAVFVRAASYFLTPACKAHELMRSMSLVDELNKTSDKMINWARKFFIGVSIVACATCALVTSPAGVAIRALVANMQKVPYIFTKGNAPTKTLPEDRTFTLLSWNICCVGGGYAITNGGVMPWSYRIDDIANRIIEKDADVNCIYETFDVESAFVLCEKLQQKGYSHFYYNMGQGTFGITSGIFVASKYEIQNPEFTPYPLETLVGRTKNAAKGLFSFDLVSSATSFAHVITTHLQHSEQPGSPTEEEFAARRAQMEIVMQKVNQVRDKCLVVTGDLNLDDVEYRSSSWHTRFVKGDAYSDLDRTWGGDGFCTSLVGDPSSGPLNLDHTMVAEGSAQSIRTELVGTGFEGTVFNPNALSDHRGLFSRIILV